MNSLKAWLVKSKDQKTESFIQLKFPMIDLKTYDVFPLFMHPTALESSDLKLIEKRFDLNQLQGNLVYLRDFPDSNLFWS